MRSTISRRMALGPLLAALVALLLAAAACTQTPPLPASSEAIVAQNVWARPAKMMSGTPMEGDTQPMHGGANSAVYMGLINSADAADRLVAAQTDVANAVEIHETKMEGDVMRMQQVEGGIEIPAKTQVELKPGGLHVMLIGLTRDLNVGDKFPVTLQFASGKSLTVETEVRQP